MLKKLFSFLSGFTEGEVYDIKWDNFIPFILDNEGERYTLHDLAYYHVYFTTFK